MVAFGHDPDHQPPGTRTPVAGLGYPGSTHHSSCKLPAATVEPASSTIRSRNSTQPSQPSCNVICRSMASTSDGNTTNRSSTRNCSVWASPAGPQEGISGS
uniref:(northern house mosquito) hypothetical protein n=1 Tax=Culex pipiens TaxID=7175 RepID=A0A8D8IWM4_CULPI